VLLRILSRGGLRRSTAVLCDTAGLLALTLFVLLARALFFLLLGLPLLADFLEFCTRRGTLARFFPRAAGLCYGVHALEC
jgi:hypothetical protein